MPRNYGKRGNYRGKKTGKLAAKRRGKKVNRNIVTLNPRAGLPLPPRFRTTLTYCGEHVTSVGASGAVGNFQYALNSVYDPYVTAGGHQPMGFDQLMAFYQFCRVYAAKVTVMASPGSSALYNPPYVGVAFSENASWSPTSLELIAERGNASYRMVPAMAAASSAIVVKRNWSAKKWWNKVYPLDESNANTATSGPTGELCYANVFVCPPNTGASFNDVYINVRIEYFVEFYGQLQLNQS